MVDASTLNEHIVACITILEAPILENAFGLVISPHKSFLLYIDRIASLLLCYCDMCYGKLAFLLCLYLCHVINIYMFLCHIIFVHMPRFC